nr:cytochrome c biogenesis protein CcsA [Parachlamydia sp. AcF125]
MVKYWLFFLCAVVQIGATNFEHSDFYKLPVLYQGRFRPLNAYTLLSELDLFHTATKSPDFLWNLFLYGHPSFDHQPLFKIDSPALKIMLGFSPQTSLFSYHELHQALFEQPETNLAVMRHLIPKIYLDSLRETSPSLIELTSLAPGLWIKRQGGDILVVSTPKHSPWQHLTEGMVLNTGEPLDQRIAQESHEMLRRLNRYVKLKQKEFPLASIVQVLKDKQLTSQEIALFLEEKFPLLSRILESGSEFQMLPLKAPKDRWVSLSALSLEVFDPETGLLKPISNFTLYSDSLFNDIQTAYLALLKENGSKDFHRLIKGLKEGYSSLENTVYRKSAGKQLSYPSTNQLHLEAFYYSFPLLEYALFFYVCSGFCFFLAYSLKNKFSKNIAIFWMILGFVCHTGLLALRCYILQRPPVSNMFETLLYVPWVAVCASFFFYRFFQNIFPLLGACIVTIPLLALLSVSRLNTGLENVQAVLDSQYWLTIHVLMIVGSYSFFLLCGILGHLLLYAYSFHLEERDWAKKLEPLILHSMYVGTALLIPGTLLGGVWAAESWGRFWDWDPKESWAFISSCIYLFWIHLYRFHHIKSFGLAFGAAVGMQSIIFTWYGVNYILGTGLHSYGFGSGDHFYYFLFIAIDFGVLLAAALRYIQRR